MSTIGSVGDSELVSPKLFYVICISILRCGSEIRIFSHVWLSQKNRGDSERLSSLLKVVNKVDLQRYRSLCHFCKRPHLFRLLLYKQGETNGGSLCRESMVFRMLYGLPEHM